MATLAATQGMPTLEGGDVAASRPQHQVLVKPQAAMAAEQLLRRGKECGSEKVNI